MKQKANKSTGKQVAKKKIRVPSMAIGYFYDKNRSLKFIYPSSQEHPDVIIKRTAAAHGVTAAPGTVAVTEKYFEIVRQIQSGQVPGIPKREPRVQPPSVFDPPTEAIED